MESKIIKTNNHVSCEFFRRVDDSTDLGKFFNIIFDKLNIVRMIYCPQSYESLRIEGEEPGNVKTALADVFYDLCLGELYLHGVIKNLNRWQELINEYNVGFVSSWKYYAISKRTDAINEYGGDESDYNEDGSVRPAGDDDLISYSIIKYLVPDDRRDIFVTTRTGDLFRFAELITASGKFDVTDAIRKCFKVKIPSYRSENGEMIENTFADELIYRIEKEDSAVLIANTLMTVCNEIRRMINEVKRLDKKSDNKEFFSRLPYRIRDIFDLKVEPCNFFE
ncbi:MAG: hypothetical protein FWF53_05640 [Candidatus Azobacteroides sp.]|nr:hypothetical protein [Candidatus Azobacteroides sp.]